MSPLGALIVLLLGAYVVARLYRVRTKRPADGRKVEEARRAQGRQQGITRKMRVRRRLR